jgi:hypothetical protein
VPDDLYEVPTIGPCLKSFFSAQVITMLAQAIEFRKRRRKKQAKTTKSIQHVFKAPETHLHP